MSVHVAVVKGCYAGPILRGAKTVECRLAKTRGGGGGPFGKVAVGDRIYFKKSGGAFFARAMVSWVWQREGKEVDIDEIQREFGEAIGAEESFWAGVEGVKFATLIGFDRVEAVAEGPTYERQFMRAWYVLDPGAPGVIPLENDDPEFECCDFEVELTAGAIRNRYVSLGEHGARFDAACFGGRGADSRGETVELRLEGGPVVHTDIVGAKGAGRVVGGRFRWRRWGGWTAWCGLSVGDRLGFMEVSRRVWRVQPIQRDPKERERS
jgi:hypothetical protein